MGKGGRAGRERERERKEREGRGALRAGPLTRSIVIMYMSLLKLSIIKYGEGERGRE
jgi:hypothetical protein